MQLFVNLNLLQLIMGFAYPEQFNGNQIPGKRGNACPYAIQFGIPYGSAQEIDLGAETFVLKFGAKVQGDYDGKYVVSNFNRGTGLFAYVKTGGSTFTDAATVINTPALTSETAAFSIADQGNPVAGPGIPSGATILSVQGPMNATMSANATATGNLITIVISGRIPVYTVNPSFNTTKLNWLLGFDPNGFAETTDIYCDPDVGGTLDGKCFKIYDAAGSVGVWIALNNGVTAQPAGATACARQIKITTINTNDTAATVATKIAAALGADAQFTGTSYINIATITANQIGPRTASVDISTGFTIEEDIPGSAPNTLPKPASVPLMGEIAWIINGNPTSTLIFQLVVYNAVNNGNEGIPDDSDPAFPEPGLIALNFVAGKYRIKVDGTFELWNATQNLFQSITITGAAGAEIIQIGAGEA